MTDVVTSDLIEDGAAQPVAQNASAPEVVFDLARLNGEEIQAYIRAENASDIDNMAKGLAKACVSIRGYSGKITPQMFSGLKYRQWHNLMKLFRKAFTENEIPELDLTSFKFDLDDMLAKDMVTLNRGLRALNAEMLVGVLCKLVKKVPMGWGAPGKAETWMKRSYFGVIVPVVQAIIVDATDGEKNESDSSIFGFPT